MTRILDSIFKIFPPKICFLGLLIIVINGQSIFGQISTNEFKATLILHFCENIEWPEPIEKNFTIGCFSDNGDIYKLLKPTENKLELHGKPIKIIQADLFEELLSCEAIYFNKKGYKDITKLFEVAREKSILLITDNFNDQLFVFINLLETNDKISFKVNMPNLTLARFGVKPNLLLNGGSVVDIKAAYNDFEKQLNESRKNFEKSEQSLLRNNKLLLEKDKIIQEKELEINNYLKAVESFKKESEHLVGQVNKERNLLLFKTKELLKKDSSLKIIYNEINKRQIELVILKNSLDSLYNESDTLKNEISEKNVIVSKQEVYISGQRKLLLLSLALIAALVLSAFTLSRLFFIKKKHTIELENKVNERTKELQLKTALYESLFSMAPVAIMEIDFSEVKNYLGSKNINSENEFILNIESNPEFARECLLKLKFLNVNDAALKLYKLNNIDEFYSIYAGISDKSVIKTIGKEMGFLLTNLVTSNYETIRFNSDFKEINVLMNWIDISDEKECFSRVLLTSVDVTKLRKIEAELRKHQVDLELLVKERTDEIVSLNEELTSQNEELNTTNEALENANNEMKIANDILNEQKQKLKKAMEELQHAQIQMVQSEKMASLGILTAGVAHEINNPLNFIQSGLYALENTLQIEKDYEKLIDTSKKIIENMQVGVHRASSIVKSLNTFSRKDKQLIKECNIHEIIENALLILNHEIKNKCSIFKNFTTEPIFIKANEENLHQVFLNILMNSIQAIEQEGEIKIVTSKIGTILEIRISDNGIGIPTHQLEKIFDPFFTTKEAGKGVGLGLSIVYKIINEHNGKIQYFSEENKGTTVFIKLPLDNN